MKRRLPDFFSKHKICIICEGNEEYEYLSCLKKLKVWNDKIENEKYRISIPLIAS